MKMQDAGAGETRIDMRFGSIFMQSQQIATAGAVLVKWTLPAGNWWRIHIVSAYVETGAAAATTAASLVVNYGLDQLFLLVAPTPLPLGSFYGNLMWMLGVPVMDNTAQSNVLLPLPDVFVPPECEVTLQLVTNAGTVNGEAAYLIARAVANLTED